MRAKMVPVCICNSLHQMVYQYYQSSLQSYESVYVKVTQQKEWVSWWFLYAVVQYLYWMGFQDCSFLQSNSWDCVCESGSQEMVLEPRWCLCACIQSTVSLSNSWSSFWLLFAISDRTTASGQEHVPLTSSTHALDWYVPCGMRTRSVLHNRVVWQQPCCWAKTWPLYQTPLCRVCCINVRRH